MTGDTKAVYTTCRCNCGSNSQCILKAHVRDGVVVAVEPDDRYNTGCGREDEAISKEDLVRVRLQRRPCTKGLAFHKYLYHPERILYPLKRIPGTRRGEGRYERISWDEALDTIAARMQETRSRCGRYSVITPYMPNETLERIFSFWGAGAGSWGYCSYDAARMMSHLVAGEKGWDYHGYMSGSAPDMLAHSKLIIIWGYDPSVGSSGPAHQFGWFIKLCREKGIPVVIFDPRYTVAAEVLADQWIPIKPGTDHAMFLALAYVLFKRDDWDRGFVERYVEPNGFRIWKDYVLGITDGEPKTPEWAEKLCAVPAETISALAELIGTVKPAFLLCHWSVTRKSRGESTVRSFAALQAMLGYWGTPGAGPPFIIGPRRDLPVQAPLGPGGDYQPPKLFRSHHWAQAVLLLDDLRRGELSDAEYMRRVGWRASPELLSEFNPKMLFWGGGNKPHASDHLVTACETASLQVQALQRMDFVVTMHSILTASAAYADIILPAQDWMWEEKNIFQTGAYGGFEAIHYCPGVVAPPGEVRPWLWVYTKLAEKLGIPPRSFFPYYTTDENWDADWERFQRESYAGIENYYRQRGVSVPAWEEFTQGRFINCDELDDRPFTGWDEQIQQGKPFKTESGKIEFYSGLLADPQRKGTGQHADFAGRVYDNLPSDWGSLPPSAVYEPMVRGLADPLTSQYPFLLLAPHCRYRVHYLFWEHPWLKDHVYRHRLWINSADAYRLGIKDDDRVMAYNDRGRVVMQAYVTARIMPGLVAIHHGGKFIPGPDGIDFGASPSSLLGGDTESCVTPAKATNLVNVVKYEGEP